MVVEREPDAVHISLDDFYLNEGRQPDTWDDPSALEWGHAQEVLHLLDRDGIANVPEFSFEEVKRVGYTTKEARHVVVEGLWTLYSILRGIADVGVYIDTPLDVRFARRVRRDTEERGCTVEEAIEGFELAREKEQEHVEFQREHAEFVIDGRPTEDHADAIARLL